MQKNRTMKEEIMFLFSEIKNPRNDGWVQKNYLDQLLEIKSTLDSLNLQLEAQRFCDDKIKFDGQI